MQTATVNLQDKRVDRITDKIINLQNATTKNCIEIGNLLIEAKSMLGHGEWLSWLKDKVDFTERTAQRFMAVAKEFPNTTTLSFSKMLLLLQIPQDEREDYINQPHKIESGEQKTVNEMSVKELKATIKPNRYKCKIECFSNGEFVDIAENTIQCAKALTKYVSDNKAAIEPADKEYVGQRIQQVIKELKRIDNSLSGKDSSKYYNFGENGEVLYGKQC